MYTDGSDNDEMSLPPSFVAAMDMVFGVSGWTGVATMPMLGHHQTRNVAPPIPFPFLTASIPVFASLALDRQPSSLVSLGMPSPISTVDFPLPTAVRRTKRKRTLPALARQRGRTIVQFSGSYQAPETCCVCLDGLLLTAADEVELPGCRHRLHSRCLWAVLTGPSLGADSMMRCPMCRQALDRYDLRDMGCAVGPADLRCLAQACHAFRSLLTSRTGRLHAEDPVAHATQVAHAIRQAATLTARDGFVYNTCILSLERMLDHKLQFVNTLAVQLSVQRRGVWPAGAVTDFVDSALACHVDVLRATARAVAAD